MIALPVESDSIWSTFATKLPRLDINKKILIVFIGLKSMYKKILSKITEQYAPLRISFEKCMQWLVYFKQVGNPYFQNITIPETEDEKLSYKEALKKMVDAILAEDNVSVFEDPKSNLIEDRVVNTSTSIQMNPGQESKAATKLSDILLTEIPHQAKVEKSLFESVHNAITPDEAQLTEEGKLQYESKIFQKNALNIVEDE